MPVLQLDVGKRSLSPPVGRSGVAKPGGLFSLGGSQKLNSTCYVVSILLRGTAREDWC